MGKIANEVNDFYGHKNNSYRIILTILQLGNYGIEFDNNGILKINCILSIKESSYTWDGQSEKNSELDSLNTIIHEFSHPYINPLTDKYIEEVNSYKAAYDKLSAYKAPGFISGYTDWTECVNEHIVRAISIHIGKKIRTSDLEHWYSDIFLIRDIDICLFY